MQETAQAGICGQVEDQTERSSFLYRLSSSTESEVNAVKATVHPNAQI